MNYKLNEVVEEVLDEEEYYMFPASFAQKGLWFLDEWLPGSPAYTLSFPKRIHGRLNVSALVRSMQEIVSRHESLRTCFSYEEGQLVQVVKSRHELSVMMQDMSGLNAVERDEQAIRLACEDALKPFVLSEGPLIRVSIAHFAEDDHVLLLSVHHIVFDGWSVNILFNELESLYRGYCFDEPCKLQELDIQYGDYAVWQQGWTQTEDFQDKLQYWRERLRGYPPLIELPTDRTLPARPTSAGGCFEFAIPEESASRLAVLGLAEGATDYMVYMTAFQLFLYRYCGQDDLCIGSLNANRDQDGVEHLIGFFVNTLVHRARIRKGISFRERLRQVREECLEAFAYADVPFDKIVEELYEDRSSQHSPLFQVLFECQNEYAGETELELTGLTAATIEAPGVTNKFDLSLYIRRRAGAVWGMLEYSSDLFDHSTIERMAQHFLVLLEGMARLPDLNAERIPLLTPEEQEEWERDGVALWDMDENEHVVGSRSCIHVLFEEQAARTPDTVALECEAQTLTYRELNERANRLARLLHARGVKQEDRVCLCFERSLDLVVAILAVLKAGAAYVPIDPASPEERTAFILEDAQASLLLTLHAESSIIACLQPSIEVLELDNMEEPEPLSGDNPGYPVQADNLAYVIYTSGSTGKPKGVMIEHANVHRLFSQTADCYGFHEQDVWTLFHSYAFDFSVWEIWGALFHGGKLIIVPYWVSRSPEAFYQLLVERKVTVLNQTPSSFRQLIQIDQREPSLSAGLMLRYIIFGGEALDFRSLRPWFEQHGDDSPKLINMYGITETTVHVTYRRIQREDAWKEAGSGIGVPIPDLKIHVLDEWLQPVPPGVFGEMYVEGKGLARGYLNRPELTEERFIVHPFSDSPGRRLYKTGDVARILPSGELEYRGRADTQIKLRGFRIEPGEIESALQRHSQVTTAVVAVKRGPGGQEILVGYVVPKDAGGNPNPEQLRSFLLAIIPNYMIPAFFVPIEHIPLTINGKTDIRALPLPDFERAVCSKSHVPPATDEEEIMVGVWEQVLQVKGIGVEDHYFEIGGDSIRSLQILYLAREAGLVFAVQDLFAHPTIRALVQAMKAGWREAGQKGGSPSAKEDSIGIMGGESIELPEQVVDMYPLSQSQLGMIYHSSLDSSHSFYHNVHSFHLQAPYSEEAWRKTLAEMLARHPSLRTSFDLTNDRQPVQLVHREVALPVSFVDMRACSRSEEEAILELHWNEERNRPFDWSQAPLIRFFIHQRSEDRFQLGITEHHAILDGWSVAVMQAELFQLYLHNLGLVEPLPVPPMATYKDYISLEQDAVNGPAAKEFWMHQLEGAELHTLPRYPRFCLDAGSEPAKGMQFENIPLAETLSQRLKGLATGLRVPLKSVLLAAHLRVVALLCNRKEAITGIVMNGRPEEKDGERALGMFLNTLPFRMKMTEGTWKDFILAVFELEQHILPHRRYPLAQIQQDHSGNTLFETFFNYTNFHVWNPSEYSPHLTVLDELSYADTHYAFGVEFSQDVETACVRLDIRWDGDQFSEEQIERIGGYYQAALWKMMDCPDGKCMEANLLSEAELNLQLQQWNDTVRPYPVRSLHEWFEEQVKRTPDRIAVSFEGAEWTYEYLNRQADRIARSLKAKGVGDNVKVGLLFERSLELVACLLGVIKSGGAYVPFDPDSPSERMDFQLEDAGIAILAVQHKYKDYLRHVGVPVITVEELLEPVDAADVDGVVSGPSDVDCIAYMIYTSGSTGKPKGVIISHRSISNRLMWMQEEYRLTAEDRVLQKTPYTFDVSVWEFFWPLITGARLVIARPEGHKNPHYLADIIQSQSVTTVHFVPSVLSLFVEEAAPDKCRSLRRVFSSGEALPFQLKHRFLERFAAELHNLYGPTEAAVDVSYWPCRSESGSRVVPIGRPVANTQLYILNDQLEPLPIGTIGELFIGGVQVGSGYHNREQLTKERFIPDPFRKVGRLYRTGDMARYLPDGNIEYLGRNDHQVKINGQRIELGEIEFVLNSHPAVRDSVVMAQPNAAGDTRLVAYITGQPHQVEEIEDDLRRRLPAHMVPYLVVMENLPYTTNGKLDRSALQETRIVERTVVYPFDELEAELAQIWEEDLNLAPVSMHDRFLDLGGSSIAAIRLISRMNKRFGADIPLAALFQGETIRELAARLRQTQSDAIGSPSHLVQFSSVKQAKKPFFLVHPIGGSAFCYRELAARLEEEFSVYGFQSIGLDPIQQSSPTVEEMAASYLQTLLEVQDEGPYYVGGWSFGGVIAYEMALQLQASGKEVALLSLFDSYAPVSLYKRDIPGEEELFSNFIRDLLGLTEWETVSYLQEALEAKLGLEVLLPLLQKRGDLPPDMDTGQVELLLRSYQMNLKAESLYCRPRNTLRAPTLLVLACEGVLEEDDHPTLGWSDLIESDIDTAIVPGNHYAMLRGENGILLADNLTRKARAPR